MSDYLPWEFDDETLTDKDAYDKNWFDALKTKYKTCRAQILPKEEWQPLLDRWLEEYPNPDSWFILHVQPGVDADSYKTALKTKGFTWSEVENQYRDTPIYLETPVSGLDVDQSAMLDTIRNMENHNGMLYYRNIPAPIIDKLYKDVFEERLIYPERFD